MSNIDSLSSWFKPTEFKNADFASRSPKQLSILLDHMELRAICHMDKLYSTGDVFNLVDDDNAISNELDLDGLEPGQPYPNTVSIDEIIKFIRIRLEKRRDEWAAFWPFELIVDESGYCSVLFQQHHPKSNLYIYFLLALYGKYLQHPNCYRSFFEEICLNLSKKIFNTDYGWTVKQLGAAATSEDAYGGNNHQNMQYLINDLCLGSDALKSHISTSGDSGLDLVAFHKCSNNTVGNLPFVTMQCACSADIKTLEVKATEASYARLSSKMNLDIAHSHILFSPYDWFDHLETRHFVSTDTSHAIIFDRARILQNLVDLNVDVAIPDAVLQHIDAFMQTQETFD